MEVLLGLLVVIFTLLPAVFPAVTTRRLSVKDRFYEAFRQDGTNAHTSSALGDLFPCHPGSWYVGVYDPVTGGDAHQVTLDVDELSGWRFREHDRNVVYACAWGRAAPPAEWVRAFDGAVDAMRHVKTRFFQSWMVAPSQYARQVFLELADTLRSAGVRYRMLHVVAKGNGLHERHDGPAVRVRHRPHKFTAAIIFDTNSLGSVSEA